MKKKLLTLTITLVLLIGLVAVMGMNASAADKAIKSYVDVNSWEDLYDFLQQAPGGFTAILTEDIVERNDSYGFEFPIISAGGTIVIDMNGHDIDITSDATEYLFKVGGNSATKLHIVNTKDEGGNIILNSKYTGAHIIQVAQEASEVNLYAGVTLVMGTDGRYFNAHLDKTTAAINAMNFKNINLYGASILNRMAYGIGINFTNLDNNAYETNESRVYISTGSVIKSKYVGLYCFNSTSAPIINLYDCTFEWESSLPTGASNYCAKANYDAFYFYKTGIGCTDLLAYSTYKMKQDGNSIDTTKAHNYYVGAKITVTPSDCPHISNTTAINYLAENGGQPGEAHFMVCGLCRKHVGKAICTYVSVKPSTCTETGYSKGGLDCICGLKTAVVEATKEHEYKLISKRDSTCTSIGYSTDIYLCENCSGKFDSNKVELTPVQFGKIVIPKKSHDYQDVITNATLIEDGAIENKCSVCGDVKSTVTVYYPKTIKLSSAEVTYNGKVRSPSVTVKDSKGNTLVKGTDYDVTTPSGRKAPGQYTYTIKFKGNFSGEKKLTFTILPKAPAASDISATQSTSVINLKWKASEGATGYRVYQYSASKGKFVQIASIKTTSYKKSTNLKAGTEYKFKIKPYTKLSDGTVLWGTASAEFVTATECKAPSITSVTSPSKSKATVKWSNVDGETGFQLYYSTKKDSGYKKIDSYSANKLTGSKIFSSSSSGKTIYFKVRAYKKTDSGTVYSAWSSIKSVKIK